MPRRIAAPADHPFRHHIIACARGWIGTPFHHQASCKGVGCDCLGLIRGVWLELYGVEGETPQPYSPLWSTVDEEEILTQGIGRHLIKIDEDQAACGDVILFRLHHDSPARHCAIIAESDTMIHILNDHQVCEVSQTPWWHRHRAGIFAFPLHSASTPHEQ